MKRMIMKLYLFSMALSVLTLLFECTSFAGEINVIVHPGFYSGRIVSISRCKAAEGDKRFCNYLDVKQDSGILIRSEFYLHVKIEKNNRTIYNGPDTNKPSFEQANILTEIVKDNVKSGSKVDFKVICGGDAGCYVTAIAVRE